ncbi:MAG: hypothetical protein HC841_05025 [Verrucomicrobiae bacterium]|nr:hypothetical protein [Verrucomicrobiae bacterium]
MPIEDTYYYKIYGGVPERRLDWNRALAWRERVNDPNAGMPPPDGWLDDAVTDQGYHRHHRSPEVYAEGPAPSDPGYQDWAEANYGEHDWAKPFTAQHIGGTMRPVQAFPTPCISAHSTSA